MEILRAGTTDISMARQACDLHERKVESDEAIAAFLCNRSNYMYVAVRGDEVVGSLNGYALAHPHRPEPQFLLYEIDVMESWRQQGVGSKLINAFVEEAQKQNAFEVWVLTNHLNEAAMALYRKCGFTRINSDDVMFSREL